MKTTTGRKALAAAVGLATASLTLVPAVAASAAPKAPKTLTVQRDGADTLAIRWSPVPGVSHYTVTLFDGTQDRSTVVDAKTTELTVPAPGACTRWQVRVAAADASGTASTGVYRVPALAPGGVWGMGSDRAKDQAVAYWEAPRAPGAGDSLRYTVRLKQLDGGKIVQEYTTTQTKVGFTDLDPRRQYAVKVTAENEYGSCVTSTALLRNDRPAAPAGLQVFRDGTASAIVVAAWDEPAWQGFGRIDGYQVFYRTPGGKVTSEKVPADQTKVVLKLDPDRAWIFQVRALGTEGVGEISKPVTLLRDGAPGTEELDPNVRITEAGQVVGVTFTGPVGSSKRYPQMRLDIQPTVGKGFRDTHVVSNGAGALSFGTVPCGVYTVVVTGMGGGDAKEFGRQAINLCNEGLIPQNLWRKVFGQADITGNTVDMRYGNESRVMSTIKREKQDAVFTTEATLRDGWGYGIWTRAVAGKDGKISGYSFQYDPGYANVNAGFGKALLLRLWQDGRECGTPIARVKWPTGLAVNAQHKIVVVTEGDTLYASIDGIKMFDVPSLQSAVKQSRCDMGLPQGTEVGFRSWNAKSSVLFENTTLN